MADFSLGLSFSSSLRRNAHNFPSTSHLQNLILLEYINRQSTDTGCPPIENSSLCGKGGGRNSVDASLLFQQNTEQFQFPKGRAKARSFILNSRCLKFTVLQTDNEVTYRK